MSSPPLRAFFSTCSLIAALPVFAADIPDNIDILLGLSLADLMEVSVLGQGETRQAQDLVREDLQYAVPGSNPLKVLGKLSGVHFQSADPWGTYEWSTKLSIRGFNQRQLGFTLDGVPLGDMMYGNSDGLHISRAIIPENLEKVRVAQGSGALGTAAVNNLGGTVQFSSGDPAKQAGVSLRQTFGSSDSERTFLRLDSGEFAPGTTAYLSVSRIQADKWKGWGLQNAHEQVNAKLSKIVGDHRFGAFVGLSRRFELDYVDYSLNSQQRLGWDWDYYAPDWRRSVDAAQGNFSGAVASADDAYYAGGGLRHDELGRLSADLALGDALRFKNTLYYHHDRGQGHWYTPYSASASGLPMSVRTSDYGIERGGLLSSLDYTWGRHQLSAGLWLEFNRHQWARRYFDIAGPIDASEFLEGARSTQFRQDFDTLTRQFSLQDTLRLLDDRLTLSFGAKSPWVRIQAESLNSDRAAGEITSSKALLPQFGANYQVSDATEVFFSYAHNARLFTPGRQGLFDVAQDVFERAAGQLKPEQSRTFDLGLRYRRDDLQASLTAYQVHFHNRLLRVAQCANIVGCPDTLANVGDVDTRGLEGALLWLPLERLSWFNSFSYNDSRYQSDYWDGETLVRATGKTVVDTPTQLWSSELSYEQAAWFVRLGMKYTGPRYISYLNDSKVPGFNVWHLGFGYTLKQWGRLRNLRAQANVVNLLDKQYFSTVGSNNFATSDPDGGNYTLHQGSARQVFFTLGGQF